MATHAQQGKVQTAIDQVARRSSLLPLPVNHQFKYYVALDNVAYRAGVCRFNPVQIAIIPGIHNVPSSGDPTTIDGLQVNKLGRVQVPLDFKVLAWGEESAGYMLKLSIGADLHGKELFHYHDVWTRYQKLGATYVRTFDADGWADFCKRVEAIPGVDGPPHPQVAEAARSRLLYQAEQHRRTAHVSPGGMANAAMIEAALTVPTSTPKRAGK